MFTLEYSRRPLKLMVKQWRLASSTYLILLPRIMSLNGEKIIFKTIQITFSKSWCKHFASNSEQ
jgi:hypothetical protein